MYARLSNSAPAQRDAWGVAPVQQARMGGKKPGLLQLCGQRGLQARPETVKALALRQCWLVHKESIRPGRRSLLYLTISWVSQPALPHNELSYPGCSVPS